ncbi:transposase family protein [Streptomyces mirabilis]|uniref:transposase family protein n=1 Tax=Streptomyces mirabilis TaxID=68239 RepID=UPI0037DA4322
MLITLVCLRLQLPHAALAELYGVTRPTVTRAIHEIRPLPARRGLAVPQRPVRGCIPWLASSPMPRSRKSTCASTEPKCKSAVPGPDEQAARRSCPARRSRASPEEAEHRQDHHDQRRLRPAAVVRHRPAGPHARPDRRARRGHRRAVPPAPEGESRGRRGLPRTGQRVPRPGQCPAEETEG